MLKRSLVCASARDQVHHRISGHDLVLDFEPQVREGRAPGRHDLDDECSRIGALVAEVRELIAEEALHAREVSAVPHQIEISPHHLCIRALGNVLGSHVIRTLCLLLSGSVR
jgi:hypothetical protein